MFMFDVPSPPTFMQQSRYRSASLAALTDL
jgi:hypothetical protein